MRSVSEWRGKNDDSPIPERVRVRVFERLSGRCFLSGRIIRAADAWQCDHMLALCNGGEHREFNLVPVLVAPHKIKTAQDRKLKAKNDRVRRRHLGIKKRKRTIAGRKFDGTPIPSRWVS